MEPFWPRALMGESCPAFFNNINAIAHIDKAPCFKALLLAFPKFDNQTNTEN